MSRSAPMRCSECGQDITLDGAQICPQCDPDVMTIITTGAKTKTPDLCAKCYQEHVEGHKKQDGNT